MASNFKTLPTKLYINPSYKLQIIRAELTSDLTIAVDLLNLSEEVISEVYFEVKYFDENNNFLFNGNPSLFHLKDLQINPHELYYLKPIKVEQRFSDAKGISIRLSDLYFENSKIDNLLEEYPFTLPIIIEIKRKKILEVFGPEIISYGENTPKLWRCVCGAFNSKEDYECQNCLRNKEFILSTLTEPLMNMKILSSMSDSDPKDKKNQKVINSLTQTQMVKIALTSDDLEKTRVNREIDESEKKKKDFKIKLYFYIFLGLFIVFGGFFGFKFYRNYRNDKDFNDAKAYLEKGQYQLVLEKLEGLKYNDKYETTPLIEKAHALIDSRKAYDKGNSLISQGRYIDAIKEFKKVLSDDKDNYLESQNRISELEELILQDADSKIAAKDYESALNLLNSYLDVINESAKAENLRNSIINYRAETGPETVDPSEALELEKSRAEINKKSESIINTYQKITIDKANLRDEPSLKSNIITVLPKESDIYILETKIEGIERIWCKVKAEDSITGESYEGWLSSNTFKNK
ncbi:SH3 domain-containing protein [Peptoniphilus catoniae]|uniref:SH3 domain-containing protein n=1 Tax=Peptoniphilus catoniae TaxID=1660341 RepID=UPI0010FD8D7B|nr:SH3 domain-containing protein [Peptoniphilus catoniae]